MTGVPGQYQAQYQGTHQTQPPTVARSTLTATQIPTPDQNVNPEPPVAHQAAPQVPQNAHEPLKSSHESDFRMRLTSKKVEPPKDRHSNPAFPVDTAYPTSGKESIFSSLSTKNTDSDVTILENDENMHKRAEDLAGKISATVTITTNATSKHPV